MITGVEKFGSHKSTPVKVSYYQKKLFIFEPEDDGVLLGEAVCLGPSKIPESVKHKAEQRLKANELDHIVAFLEDKGMHVQLSRIINHYRNGLTLVHVKKIYEKNQTRYEHYLKKITVPKEEIQLVLFNAFLIDIERYNANDVITPYASHKDKT